MLGLASSGPHSNGYSLIRRLLRDAGVGTGADTMLAGRSLLDRLMAPTRIYARSMLALARALPVRGFAHITGGGLTGNIPRVIPDGLEVVLRRAAWPRDPVFDWLQRAGNVSDAEMHRTFNCGIGMVAVVAADKADEALRLLNGAGERATLIGHIRVGNAGVVID